MSEFREILSSSALEYGPDGLIPVILVDPLVMVKRAKEGIRMWGWANAEAIDLTLETREATLWSRARQELWFVGKLSGNAPLLNGIYANCFNDCILYDVETTGATCYKGAESCFQVAEGEQ